MGTPLYERFLAEQAAAPKPGTPAAGGPPHLTPPAGPQGPPQGAAGAAPTPLYARFLASQRAPTDDTRAVPKPPAPPSTNINDVGYAVARGAMPFANDLTALAVKLGSFGSANMGKVRQVLQDRSDAFDHAHPLGSAAAQITGALSSGLTTGVGSVAEKVPELVAEHVPALARLAKAVPMLGKAGKLAAEGAEGAAVGSLYGAGAAAPGHRLEGVEAGAPMGAMGALAAKPVLKALNIGGRTLLNTLNIRPSEATVLGRTVTAATPINSVEEEARHVLLNKLQQSGLTPEAAAAQFATPSATGKPLTLTEAGGVPMQRLARGIHTGAPQASAHLQQAFLGRGAGAEERVLGDIMDASGQAGQPSAYRTTQSLLAQRTAEANANYPRVLGRGTTVPLDATAPAAEGATDGASPSLGELLKRPSLRAAAKYAKDVAAERGEAFPDLPSAAETKAPQAASNDLNALLKLGVPADKAEAGVHQAYAPPPPAGDQAVPLSTLHQLKIKLDDALGYAKTRGTLPDGSAATKSKLLAIQDTRGQLLRIMDHADPEYGQIRQQFAEPSALMDAVELGKQHFSEDPEVAADALKQMTPPEQALYRRAGVDALRQRLEAGPVQQDVSNVRGLSARTLDQKRLRLLFPDEASFTGFQDKLAHEAAMAQTNRTLFTGSNTADKLMDLADMAGVTPQHILQAATGAGGAAKLALKFALARRMLGYQGNLANALEPYLTAGANGDVAARDKMLADLTAHARVKGLDPTKAKFPAGAALAGHRTGDQLLSTLGVGGGAGSPGAAPNP